MPTEPDQVIIERIDVKGARWYGRLVSERKRVIQDWCHCPIFATPVPNVRGLAHVMKAAGRGLPAGEMLHTVTLEAALARWRQANAERAEQLTPPGGVPPALTPE